MVLFGAVSPRPSIPLRHQPVKIHESFDLTAFGFLYIPQKKKKTMKILFFSERSDYEQPRVRGDDRAAVNNYMTSYSCRGISDDTVYGRGALASAQARRSLAYKDSLKVQH